MDEPTNTKQFINTEMPAELVEKLDAMCETDEQTRSGFIRKLIRMEFQRRNGTLVPAKVKVICQPASKTLSVAQA